jgi:DNA-binding NarL/FixJ family response regulator
MKGLKISGGRIIAPPRSSLNITEMIDAVGYEEFEIALAAYLKSMCRADHFAAFQIKMGMPLEIASISMDGTDTAHRQVGRYLKGEYWRRDPSILEASHRIGEPLPSLLRLDVHCLEDVHLRDEIWGKTRVRERILLCGGSQNNACILSVLRCEQSGAFSRRELAQLKISANALLSLLSKHMELTQRNAKMARALTSLPEIEACISAITPPFPRRENEVCARIIYGVSSLGISLDLGIGAETVMTYRKRLYQRLGIGSQRELLVWYIGLWTSLHRTNQTGH